MGQKNAAQLFKAVKQDNALQEKLKAATNPDAFIKVAQERGYHFTPEELQAEIDKLSEEELAAVINRLCVK